MGLSRRQKGQAEDPELCCICQRKGPGCWSVCIGLTGVDEMAPFTEEDYEYLKRKLEEWKRDKASHRKDGQGGILEGEVVSD